MKRIPITLNGDLAAAVARAASELNISQSEFVDNAVRAALRLHMTDKLEERHRRGYAEKPVRPGEVSIWESEQAWGDD